jgi:hypothetical protein
VGPGVEAVLLEDFQDDYFSLVGFAIGVIGSEFLDGTVLVWGEGGEGLIPCTTI